MDRRSFLQGVGVAGLGMAGLGSAKAAPKPGSRVSYRLAFMPDSHLPATGSDESFARAMDLAQGGQAAPDLIVFGGDNIFSADGRTKAEVEDQFANWRHRTTSRMSVQTRSVLGNHDILAPASASEDVFQAGKNLAASAYGMQGFYHSVSAKDWHVVFLDTVQRGRNGYVGHVDDEQITWLGRVLTLDKRPTLVVSHMPIVSVGPMLDHHCQRGPHAHAAPFNRIVRNSRELVGLFGQHPHVKACISGHLHMVDKVDFRGVSYFCCGAVSGAWWRGPYEGFEPLVSRIALLDDGTVHVHHIDYGKT